MVSVLSLDEVFDGLESRVASPEFEETTHVLPGVPLNSIILDILPSLEDIYLVKPLLEDLSLP